MQTTKSAPRFLTNPIALVALAIVIIAGLFATFFVGVRLITGHWPVQSKSPSLDDKW